MNKDSLTTNDGYNQEFEEQKSLLLEGRCVGRLLSTVHINHFHNLEERDIEDDFFLKGPKINISLKHSGFASSPSSSARSFLEKTYNLSDQDFHSNETVRIQAWGGSCVVKLLVSLLIIVIIVLIIIVLIHNQNPT